MRVAGALAAAALAAVLLARRCYAVVTVSGVSMRPSFAGGERVLARRCARAIERGAVVVAEVPSIQQPAGEPPAGERAQAHDRWEWLLPPPGRDLTGRSWMVKRVVAVPGDPTPERFAAAAQVPAGLAVPPRTVLLAGDNTGASFDSHMFGYVPVERVLGPVVRVLG